MDDVLVNGPVFMITTPAGDIDDGGPDGPRGLFHGDTRHLSRWVLTVDGVRPRVLAAGRGAHAFRPVLAPPGTGGGAPGHGRAVSAAVLGVPHPGGRLRRPGRAAAGGQPPGRAGHRAAGVR